MSIIETPLGTPTKCGCAGGIVVACSTAKVQRNTQKRHREKKSAQLPSQIECSVCAEEKAKNDRCRMDNGECNRDDIDDSHETEEILIGRYDEAGDTAIYTGKPWYASVFGGKLGRWAASSKRRNQSPKSRDKNTRPLSSPNVYQINNICTNNNCKAADRCKSNHEASTKTPPPTNKIGNGNKNKSESDLDVHRIDTDVWHKQSECVNTSKPEGQGSSESSIRPGEIKDNCTSNKPPAAGWRRLRSTHRRNGAERRLKSEGECYRQKLPDLPYRETGNENKKPVMDITINSKRQRGKRKYFSSPIHRKEPTREQSTYVSFQDDIANDVYINVDPQPDIVPISASPDSMYGNLFNPTTETPLQISPSSINDDVFTPDGIEGQQKHYMSHGNEYDKHLCANKEELDDARIAKLFHRVNSAFDTNNHEGKHSKKENLGCTETDNTLGCTKCPSYQVRLQKKSHNEPIETIMASANLHASLDNALSMLSESTKLLSPNDTQGWHHALHSMRHQPALLNVGIGSLHNTRSRTYSTCSRLETIEEENDRVEDASLDDVQKNTTTCTFGDSSEYEKVYLSSSGTSPVNASTTTGPERDSVKSSLYHQRLAGREYKEGVSAVSIKCIMNAGSCSMPRQNSTSTISIGSLRRGRGSLLRENSFPHTPTTTDKCTACEWIRNSQYQSIATSSVPNDAWKWIAGEISQCHNHGHVHPWGVCSEQDNLPTLCHSHYLQYYQYLQNDSKKNRLRRRQMHSVSSNADSLIDYDIKEVMNSLDEFAATSSDSSVTSFHRSSYQKEQLFLRDGNVLVSAQSNIRSQYLDVKKHDAHRHSNTDLSINSDSAFSTNGSLTPSTRDGANTDGESVESIHDHPGFCNDAIMVRDNGKRNAEMHSMTPHAAQGPWESNTDVVEGDSILTNVNLESSRGKRTQSYDDSGFIKVLTKDPNVSHEKRYSVVSSLGSYPSPLTSDPLGDSAVHLPDNSSSHSTHLSSDSFYSSGTSHGDKETCLIDGALSEDILSRSSSETSLKSEGTLCLSEFGISQQNISLFSAPSFPQINELISPKRNKVNIHNESKKSIQNLANPDKFNEWIEKAEMTESVLEAFLNSSLTQIETPILDASDSSSRNQFGVKSYPAVYNNDTLTSSSGSSDTNTLGSGSSGSTYATSSLRSYRSSRFNTLDSSSCVSTDDTGETVIDQFMLRPNRNLCDIQETITHKQKSRKKRTYGMHRKRYQPSTFHYQNLELPLYKKSEDDFDHGQESVFESCDNVSIEREVARNTQILVSRSRSSSTSCVLTSVIETSCVVRQCKSLPSLHFSHTSDKKTVQRIEYINSIESPEKAKEPILKQMSPIYGHVLQTKVQSMMQNCANFDNVIASLRESLKVTTNQQTSGYLDQKLVELGDILKQKDEVINQLHRMLIECSKKDYKKVSHQNNATL